MASSYAHLIGGGKKTAVITCTSDGVRRTVLIAASAPRPRVARTTPSASTSSVARVDDHDLRIAKIERRGAVDTEKVAATLLAKGAAFGSAGPRRAREDPAGPAGPVGPGGVGPRGSRRCARCEGRSGARRARKVRRAFKGCKARRACKVRKARKVRKVRRDRAGAYGQKSDLARKEARVSVGGGLVATAVASCDRAQDLLVTGGCYADPQWLAQLVATRPVAMTDSSNAGELALRLQEHVAVDDDRDRRRGLLRASARVIA